MRIVDASGGEAGGPREGADATRMTELFHATHRGLMRFVRARCPRDRVDDVVAETFLIAWRRLDSVPTDEDGARAWLFVTARHLILNDARHEGRRRHLPLRVEVAHETEPAGEAAEREGTRSSERIDDDVAFRLDLAAALRSLSAADQEVIGLAAVDGLDAAEAAEVLGTTRRAYATRLFRARQRLASALNPVARGRHGRRSS